MGDNAAAKVLAPLILVVLLFFGACGIIVSVSGDDDACAPTTNAAADQPADGSLSPGGKVKPMKSADFTITSGFGPRDGGFHQGIDLAGPLGKPIYAAADGTVAAAGTATGFGHWIVLDHNINGHVWSTVYGHMFADGVLVKAGQHVTAGQHIANRGNDGESTGPHLHFEVWDGGRLTGGHAIDPAGWVHDNPDPGSAPAPAAGATAPAPVAAAPAAPASGDVVSTADWDKVAKLESGGNWAIDTGNGYQGGLQFSPSTWTGAGGSQYAPTANKATREQQMEVANRVLGSQGWGAWPVTSKEAGVTGKKPAPAGTFVNAATAAAPTAAAPAPAPGAAAALSAPLGPLPASKGSEAHWQIDTIRIARAVAAKFPEITTIGGWRPYDNYPDHPSGRAADIMIPNYTSAEGIALGNRIQKYLMDNKKFFKVVYTIWRQRYTAATGETNIMEDRGTPTQNHFDHVHVTDEGHGYPVGNEVYTAPGVAGGDNSTDSGSADCAAPQSPESGGGVDDLASGKVPPAFEPWFRKAGALCRQITPAFLAGISKQESGFQQGLISPDGARGPMQFMDYTYPSWAKDDDGNGRADPNDIGDAVMAGGRFSCDNAAKIDAAVAKGTVHPPADGGVQKLYAEAYNAGPGAILSAGGEPSGGDFDTQTRPYGTNVIRFMHDFSKQGLT